MPLDSIPASLTLPYGMPTHIEMYAQGYSNYQINNKLDKEGVG